MIYKLDSIRILIAHESQDVAEQLMNNLRNAGRATRAELVLGEEALLRALKGASWDLLLTREQFGGCNLDTVMTHLQRLEKELPVVLLAEDFSAATWRDALSRGVQAVAPADDRELIMLLVDQQLERVQQRRTLQELELSLHEAEKRLSVLMDQSRDAIAYVLDGMHIAANENYLELFGYGSADDLAGMPIMDMVSAADHERLKQLLRSRAQDESQTQELECRGVNAEGEEFAALFVFSPSSYDGETCTQIVIRSAGVDESVLEEKLQAMSQQDLVTGLPNRHWMMDQLDATLADVRKRGTMAALVYLRIDRFEEHQSEVGIDGADQAMKLLAGRLRDMAGADTRLARTGDEEFAALIPLEDRDQAPALAERVREAVAALMPAVVGRTLHLTASVGVAFVQENSRTGQAVLTRALECCNRAQRAGDGRGNAVYVYDPLDDVEAGSSEAVLLTLRQALSQNGLALMYQPLMNLEDEQDRFHEVFVQLPQKDGDDLAPDTFMPVAAEHGLAGKVDRWVIIHALKAMARHGTALRLLINLSGYSLQDQELAPWIAKAAKAAKVDPARLVFQITEADANTFLKQAQVFSEQVGVLGCGFSIRRFAGGINPFKVFEHVSAGMVKFDGSFTQELDNPQSRETFAGLIAEASERGKQVIVGFVESAQQMQTLWTLGNIRYLQGYYLQAPTSNLVVDE